MTEEETLPWTSVFLSYSHTDKPVALSLAEGLREAGCYVWIDEGELRTGDSIIARISDAADEVRFVIALVSKNSISSSWCQKELAIAIHGGLSSAMVRVLPLRLGNVRMPSSLRDVKYTQVNRRSVTDAVNIIVNDMRSHLLEDLFAPNLQPETSMSEEMLRRMRLALRSREDDVPEKAMTALVNDKSVPAANLLFEEAIRDAARPHPWGYASAGLAELGPAAAPWMCRLLTHDDPKVVRHAFYALHELMIPNPLLGFFRVEAVVQAIIENCNWPDCERKLLNAVSDSDDRYYFIETLTDCATNILDLTEERPTKPSSRRKKPRG